MKLPEERIENCLVVEAGLVINSDNDDTCVTGLIVSIPIEILQAIKRNVVYQRVTIILEAVE